MSEPTPSTGARIATGAAVGLIAGLAASFAMDRFQALTQPKSDEDASRQLSRPRTGSPAT